MALWEHGPQFALCPVPIAFKLKHVLRAGRLTESAVEVQTMLFLQHCGTSTPNIMTPEP